MTTYGEYRQLVLDTSPWLYWPINEGRGTVLNDASGNSRPGTLAVDAYWTRVAFANPSPPRSMWHMEVGSARNTISASYTFPTSGTTEFSLMFWTWPWGANLGNQSFYLQCRIGSTDKLVIYCYNSQKYVDVIRNGATSSKATTLNSSAWQNFMFVRRSGTDYLYVNGSQVWSSAASSFSGNFDSLTLFGSGPSGMSYHTNFAFWSKALSTGEISSLQTPVDSLVGSVSVMDSLLYTEFDRTFSVFDATPVDTAASTPVLVSLGAVAQAFADLSATMTIQSLFYYPTGSVDVDVQMSGEMTVTSGSELAGSIDADFDLSGTLSVIVPEGIDGSLDVDIALSGTITRAFGIDGALDAETDLVGTLTIVDTIVDFAGSIDAEAALSGTMLTDAIFLYAMGSVSLDIALAYSIIDLNRYGSGEIDADVIVRGAARLKMRLPAPPAPAPPPDPQTPNVYPMPSAGGITLRALYGKTVTMDDPIIVDGKPT